MKNSTLTTKKTCPKCGDTHPTVIVFSDTVDFRNIELDVEGLEESKCNNCNFKWTSKKQHNHNESMIRSTYSQVRDKLRKDHGLLLGPEIADTRRKLRLNQREAAVVFGGGYNAFNKYESGEVLQSLAMDRLLRLTAAVGIPAVNFLKNLTESPVYIITLKDINDSGSLISIKSTSIPGLTIETTGSGDPDIHFIYQTTNLDTKTNLLSNNNNYLN